MSKHGTARTDTQLVEVLNALKDKTGKLTQFPVRPVFTALVMEQELIVASDAAEQQPLLESLTVRTLEAVKSFRAKDHFKKNSTAVKFSGFGSNFEKYFLDKVEENVAAVKLRTHKLLRSCRDPFIVAALGEGKEVTTLAHFFAMLVQQPNGEDGALLTNGWANVAYIYGTDGNLWAVDGFWLGVGWYVGVSPFGDLDGWHDGGQVLGG